MKAFDDRIVRVGIQVGDKIRYYQDLAIVASGTKYANATDNECEIKITNLSKETRDYILTETSPFKKSKDPKKIILEVGRVSTGTSRIFIGDIISAKPSQPPNIDLSIKATTKSTAKNDTVVRSKTEKSSLNSIAKDVARDLNLKLVFEAKDKQIANFSYIGSNAGQINELAKSGSVNAYIDDDKLIVKDSDTPLTGKSQLLRLDTGMIGIPEIDQNGIKVKYLYNNQSVVGGALQIESKLNPSANGMYQIYKLNFDVASRDNNFYLIAEAKRIESGN